MFFLVKYLQVFFKLILLSFLLIVFSCDLSTNNPNEVVFPSKNISYFNHVSPFFDEECSCHRAGGSDLDKLDISTPSKIKDYDYSKYLMPGDPDRSEIYLVIKYPDLSHWRPSLNSNRP